MTLYQSCAAILAVAVIWWIGIACKRKDYPNRWI